MCPRPSSARPPREPKSGIAAALHARRFVIVLHRGCRLQSTRFQQPVLQMQP